MAKKTRLDKFLCDSLNMTRKEAKESVKKGKVVVNGEAIKKPEYKVDAEQDQVEFDHKLIQFEQFHYLMLHKLVDCLEKCLICRHIRRFAD